MARAPNVGYDKKGRLLTANGQPVENDLPIILEKWREWKRTGRAVSSTEPLVFVLPVSDQEDSWDPRYYDPGLRSDLRILHSRMQMTRLADVLMTAVPQSQIATGGDVDETSGNGDDAEPDTSKVVKGKAPRTYTRTGIRVMMITQMKQVNRLYVLDQDGSRFISQAANLRAIASALQPGDILLAITGATIGKVIKVPSDIGEANICGDIARIRVDPTKANPYYVFAFLTSALGHRYLRSRISGSTNEHLAPQAIESLLIPMPSEATQLSIGREYEKSLTEFANSRQHFTVGLANLALALPIPLSAVQPAESIPETDPPPPET